MHPTIHRLIFCLGRNKGPNAEAKIRPKTETFGDCGFKASRHRQPRRRNVSHRANHHFSAGDDATIADCALTADGRFRQPNHENHSNPHFIHRQREPDTNTVNVPGLAHLDTLLDKIRAIRKVRNTFISHLRFSIHV